MCDWRRAIVLIDRQGYMLVNGKKTALVKDRNYKLDHECLLVIENKTALGFVVFDKPLIIDLKEFRKDFPLHKITASQRKKWWGNKRKFYLYPVIKFQKIKPMKLTYPLGPQGIVLKKSIKFS